MLPQKLYEFLRWFLTIVIPASITALVTLNTIWEWTLPVEAIVGTIMAAATFLGCVFGIAKITGDAKRKK